MPLVEAYPLTKTLMAITFKDLFDTGICIKLAVKQTIYRCEECVISADWDNYEINKKLCMYHKELSHRQTKLTEYT